MMMRWLCLCFVLCVSFFPVHTQALGEEDARKVLEERSPIPTHTANYFAHLLELEKNLTDSRNATTWLLDLLRKGSSFPSLEEGPSVTTAQIRLARHLAQQMFIAVHAAQFLKPLKTSDFDAVLGVLQVAREPEAHVALHDWLLSHAETPAQLFGILDVELWDAAGCRFQRREAQEVLTDAPRCEGYLGELVFGEVLLRILERGVPTLYEERQVLLWDYMLHLMTSDMDSDTLYLRLETLIYQLLRLVDVQPPGQETQVIEWMESGLRQLSGELSTENEYSWAESLLGDVHLLLYNIILVKNQWTEPSATTLQSLRAAIDGGAENDPLTLEAARQALPALAAQALEALLSARNQVPGFGGEALGKCVDSLIEALGSGASNSP